MDLAPTLGEIVSGVAARSLIGAALSPTVGDVKTNLSTAQPERATVPHNAANATHWRGVIIHPLVFGARPEMPPPAQDKPDCRAPTASCNKRKLSEVNFLRHCCANTTRLWQATRVPCEKAVKTA
jgi:hypothetical protein